MKSPGLRRRVVKKAVPAQRGCWRCRKIAVITKRISLPSD